MEELITLAGLPNGKVVDTSLEVYVKYRKEEGDLLFDPFLYCQLVGSFNYLTITRPDISFIVQQVCQFMHAPRYLHLAAIHHIIRYLIGTPDMGLFFLANFSLKFIGYSDAVWAGCMDTRCSITGLCTFLGSALISWRCFLAELGYPQLEPTPLHVDNTSAIQVTANSVFHEWTKHIKVDRHSIRKAYDDRIISLPRHH
ncbi:uncharacterized protein LOC111398816 [Olea europaea var. sylvestris]|uniref:uncharacterized protein LOC111398816 n=1 Tax=Olea europaea var. sylvestris TaxID=158386 RepID=UPI000C1D1FED|nr:uncharacterized protein LOC111398816 [Olea europaea var. sylvestris]